MAASNWLHAALLAAGCGLGWAEDSDGVCTAKGGCAAGAAAGVGPSRKYLWPHARGWPMNGGNSPHRFGSLPCNLSAQLAWSWEPPLGKYSNTGVQSPVVDEQRNLYVVIEDSVRKFTPDGGLVWTWQMAPPWLGGDRGPWLRKGASLADGLIITSATSGHVLALTMERGELAWNVSVSNQGIGDDLGFVVAGEGVVIGDADLRDPDRVVNNKVWALNATDGSRMWDFRPDVGVWNFLPHFLGDGTVVFQSWDGGVYRLRLTDGEVLWRARGGGNRSWTDGGPAAGPNGVLYAVRSTAPQAEATNGHPGFLDAYRISDGALLWSNSLEQTPYTWPVVGRLREGGPLAVVTGVGSLGGGPAKFYALLGLVPGGALGLLAGLLVALAGLRRRRGCGSRLGLCCARMSLMAVLGALIGGCARLAVTKREFTHSVQAFDAETGRLLWRYDLPPWRWYCAAGDEEGVVVRFMQKRTPVCLPVSSSYPVLDAQGIFYMGHMDGRLYAIQDRDGNGEIREESEVCSFDTGGAFFSSGPTLVQGLLAVGTCDSLFVFKQ